MATPTEYTAESIQVLSSMQAVRKRPGMYVGDVESGAGMHVALWEVISNAVEAHLAGHASHVRVTFDGLRVIVEDDGLGIPPEWIERVLTTLHAGTGWRREHVHLTAGMHGVGIAVTNGLAAELEVTVWRDGFEYVQRFARGEPETGVERRASTARQGMRIAYTPDLTIFTAHPWNRHEVATRLRTLAGALPGLTITVDDETWRYDNLVAYVEERAGCEVIDPFTFEARVDDIQLELALAWRCSTSSFEALVNCSPCLGGVHVAALFDALRSVLAPRIPHLTRRRLERGLVGVLHVRLDDPRFGTPSREWLQNPEVAQVIRDVTARELARYIDETPAFVDALVLDLARRVRVRRAGGRGSKAQVRAAVRG